MSRQMRYSGQTMNVAQWELVMCVILGELEDPSDWDSTYVCDEEELPTFYCDQCDSSFPGESQDLEDAPTKCPYCSQPPGRQAVIVTYGGRRLNKRSIKTFPFYAPAPTTVPELPQHGGPMPSLD